MADGEFTEQRPSVPEVTRTDLFECKRHRGRHMVSAMAREWGYFPVLGRTRLNLGLVVWADFPVAHGQLPPGLPDFIHTS